jgi:hypothetical protein
MNYDNASVTNTSGISLLKITTASFVEIDLRLNFLELNFYESVFSPVICGDIVVSEPFNFPSFGPILGGEDLKIEVWNFTSEEYKDGEKFINKKQYDFVVYSLEKKEHTNDRHQVYIIKFCSKEAIWNQQLRICTTYFNQKYTEIYWNIFLALGKEIDSIALSNQSAEEKLRELPFAQQKDFILGSSSKGEESVTVHFPNLHPFDCFFYLSGKAQKGKRGNPYFFFETLNRTFNFISWKDIIEKYNHSKDNKVPLDLVLDLEKKEDSEKKRNKVIMFNANNIILDSRSIFLTLDTFLNAASFTLDKDFDFLENVKKGVYSSKLITVDVTTKRIREFTYNFDEHYKDIPRIEGKKDNALNVFPKEDKNAGDERKKKSEYNSPTYSDSFVKVVPFQSEAFLKGKNDFTPELTKNDRVMKLQELNNNFFTVTIPGNFSITAGKFTDLFLNSPDTSSSSSGVKADVHFAGTYFNLRVRHSFKVNNTFLTSLELSKDSFLDKTLQHPPGYNYEES